MDMLLGRTETKKILTAELLSKKELNKEKIWFESHPDYADIADQQGTQYLRYKLNQLLTKALEEALPRIRSKIQLMLTNSQSRLSKMSKSLEVESNENAFLVLNKLINNFGVNYTNHLNGNFKMVVFTEITGGARIYAKTKSGFRDTIDEITLLKDPSQEEQINNVQGEPTEESPKNLQVESEEEEPQAALINNRIDACIDYVTDNEIKGAICSVKGYNADLLFPQEAITKILKKHLLKLLSPCEQYARLIYEEMTRNIPIAYNEDLKKYENLRKFIEAKMYELIK